MIALLLSVSKNFFSISVLSDNKLVYFKKLKEKDNELKSINLMIEEAQYVAKIKKCSLDLIIVASLKNKYISSKIMFSVCNIFKFILNIPILLVYHLEVTCEYLQKKNFLNLFDKKINFSSRLLCYFVVSKKILKTNFLNIDKSKSI